MKNKYVHISYSGKGGTTTYLLNYLRNSTIDASSLFIILFGIEEPDEKLTNYFNEQNIEYTFIKKQRGIDLKSFRSTRKQLNLINPTSIVVHTTSITPAVFLYKLFHSVKIIFVDHSSYKIKTFFDRFFSKLLFIISKKMVVFYKKQYTNFRTIFFSKKKITIIPKSVDPLFFQESDQKRRIEGTIKLGMAARINKSRDYETLVQAFGKINTNSHLYIAGEGEDIDRIKAIVREQHLNDKVTFHGWLDRKNLKAFYDEIDIYVHASFGETCAYSIMEALASGKPCILSKAPGIFEVYKDSNLAKMGLIQFFEVSNHKDLTNKFNLLSDKVLNNNQNNKHIIKEYAKNNFSSKENFLALDKIIK